MSAEGVSFSESVPDHREEDIDRGKKNVITICNGTNMTIYVELHPIEMVRRNKARHRNVGFGVNAAPLEGAAGVNMQVKPLIYTAEEHEPIT